MKNGWWLFRYIAKVDFSKWISETYSEPSQTSNMEPFAEIINDLQPQKARSWMFDWVLNMSLDFRSDISRNILHRSTVIWNLVDFLASKR